MYGQIEKLVREDKLEFTCKHNINPKHYLKNDKDEFLEEVGMNVNYSKKPLRNVFCFSCGKYIDYTLEGNKLIPSESECFNQKEVYIDIPVPSGELMFDDWFEGSTPLLEYLDDKTLEINSKKNRVERTLDYRKVGVGHFYTGASSPRICLKDDIFYIGNTQEVIRIINEEDDEYCEYDFDAPIVEGGEVLGNVSTSLWWVTVCDYSVYENLAVEKFGEKKGNKIAQEAKRCADLVLKVEPGIYRITYYTEVYIDHELYAKIEKIS